MADLGEIFDGSKIDIGPPTALEELSTHRQWVAWKIDMRAGADGVLKPTKPPVNPHNGYGASHSNPAHWGTYEQAEACAMRRKLPGVGFVVTETDNFVGIDLDKCRDPVSGKLDLWAEDIIALGETYAEVSPSGTGLRLIARGKVEKTIKCDPAHVEIYRSQRYLTITGEHVEDSPADIRPAPTTLEFLMDRVAQFVPKTEIDIPTSERTHHVIKRHQQLTPQFTPKGNRPTVPYFRAVNDKALANLSSWVPSIFPSAIYQPTTAGFRIGSKALGRNLEEDLAFTPAGIKDFGIADMGDANQGKRTAIDIVMEYRGEPTPIEAARWLCDRIGVTPESLGWGADETRLRALGDETAARVCGSPAPAIQGVGCCVSISGRCTRLHSGVGGEGDCRSDTMPGCFGGAKRVGGGEFSRFKPTRTWKSRRQAT